MGRVRKCSLLGLGLFALSMATVGFAGVAVSKAADYDAAARLLPDHLIGLVRNESVQPHWLGTSGRFWYRRDGAHDAEYIVVSPQGVKSRAFDHGALLQALANSLARSENDLVTLSSLIDVQLSDDLARLSGRMGDNVIECDLKAMQCRTSDWPKPDLALLRSPDGREAVFTRDNNLWIRNLLAGTERRITTDGAPHYSWGKIPDDSLDALARKKAGAATPPFETYWSPDARYLITVRTDERNVATYPFVEWIPTDGSRRPIVHEVREMWAGDPGALKIEYFLIDLKTGRATSIPLPEASQPSWSGFTEDTVLGWSKRFGQAFLLVRSVGWKKGTLFRLDLASGQLKKVIEESSPTRVEVNTEWPNQPNIRLLGDGAELIWYSDRTGWGHLYLYDAQSGQLKRALTHGDWLVHDIQSIDERRREIYFTAGGRESGRDPYYRHLYRTGLDARSKIRLLTEENADHHFESRPGPWLVHHGWLPRSSLICPEADLFIDTWSTVDQPPISVLRSTRDGHLIAELEPADASQLFATGWVPPVRERVRAADGTTDLYAVYYAPHEKQAGKTFPIIDAAYGGPQFRLAPRNFIEAYRDGPPGGYLSAYARLGFAVVTVDGRGTPGRSRAFLDAGYPEFTQVGINDHVAAIRELSRRHPEMDLERVGVNGVSWGGTFAAQAILSRPEFYKVAVSASGVYDYAATYLANEPFIEPARYPDATRYRQKPDAVPVNWGKLEVTRLAERLVGHLLIIYGDMDENVPPVQAFRLVDALTRVNKPYDLLYLPNRTHGAFADRYAIKRTWDYFVEHLMGDRPPFDAVIPVR